MEIRELFKNLISRIEKSGFSALTVLRASIGWVFLSSAIAKLMENGFAYSYASTYLEKAVPITTPEIAFSFPEIIQMPGLILVKTGAYIVEPLMQFFASIPFIGPLVVITELVIGLSLLLGFFTKLGSLTGAFMMLLFYYGNAEWSQGLLNADMIYLILLLSLISMKAGEKMSIDSYITEKYEIENRGLKKILGI